VSAQKSKTPFQQAWLKEWSLIDPTSVTKPIKSVTVAGLLELAGVPHPTKVKAASDASTKVDFFIQLIPSYV
jgi:hypothetical protein